MFIPKFGEDFTILTHIFQRGLIHNKSVVDCKGFIETLWLKPNNLSRVKRDVEKGEALHDFTTSDSHHEIPSGQLNFVYLC